MRDEPRASFSLSRHLHSASQGRQFFSSVAGPGRVWNPDANGDSNNWTAKGVWTTCSTSKMRISPSTQEMAPRHSGKKASLQPYQNPAFSEVVGGKTFKFYIHWFLWWDHLSVLRGDSFLTALWVLSLGFQVDCPSHGSGGFSPDQSSLHPGMSLSFGHRDAPNSLKKYTYGSTTAKTRQ